jgi:hypothetical protein
MQRAVEVRVHLLPRNDLVRVAQKCACDPAVGEVLESSEADQFVAAERTVCRNPLTHVIWRTDGKQHVRAQGGLSDITDREVRVNT